VGTAALLDRTSLINPNSGGLKPDLSNLHIEFVDVSFAYPSRPSVQVLKVQMPLGWLGSLNAACVAEFDLRSRQGGLCVMCVNPP
jgi:hypothetical protein